MDWLVLLFVVFGWLSDPSEPTLSDGTDVMVMSDGTPPPPPPK
jgi:hypothetical protein